jgi:hypothetical protein
MKANWAALLWTIMVFGVACGPERAGNRDTRLPPELPTGVEPQTGASSPIPASWDSPPPSCLGCEKKEDPSAASVGTQARIRRRLESVDGLAILSLHCTALVCEVRFRVPNAQAGHEATEALLGFRHLSLLIPERKPLPRGGQEVTAHLMGAITAGPTSP